MDTIRVLHDVINQLTDNFKKSESVNDLYKACRKIVEAKIAETKLYDFSHLLSWLDEMKLRCYKGKYKCTKIYKRIFYIHFYRLFC